MCVSSINRLTWLNAYTRARSLAHTSNWHADRFVWQQCSYMNTMASAANDNILLMRYEAVSTDTVLLVLESFSTFYFSFVFFPFFLSLVHPINCHRCYSFFFTFSGFFIDLCQTLTHTHTHKLYGSCVLLYAYWLPNQKNLKQQKKSYEEIK